MSTVVGVVAPLKEESRAVRGKARVSSTEEGGFTVWSAAFGKSGAHTELVCVQSGPGPVPADRAARLLIERGATVLVSTGVAGGLSPELKPGDLVVADQVAQPGFKPWGVEPGLLERVSRALEGSNLTVRRGTVVTSGEPITDTEEKDRLSKEAVAVDMESSSVARTATEAGVPFFVVRSVCDTAERALDPALMKCLDERGRPRPFYMLWLIIKRPSLIKELTKSGKEFSAALDSLTLAWKGLTGEMPGLF